MKFSVSVIIPVFNAEPYIENALTSALEHEEVKEVVVVDDGSTDASLKIINTIKEKDKRIKIYHHTNNRNRGRSTSRNLGIQKASANYIAFLDADDYYLEERFKNDKNIFNENPKVEGVYNAIGAHFYRDSLEEELDLELTTVVEAIPFHELFENLLSGKKGYFSIDGLTVKKSVFEKTGYFVENLVVAEDTDLILKMAMSCRLESGVINTPVAMRGVHDNNVFNRGELYSQNRDNMFYSLIKWALRNKMEGKKIDLLMKWLYYYQSKDQTSLLKLIKSWYKLLKNNPKLIVSKMAVKYFPLVRERKKIVPFLFKQ